MFQAHQTIEGENGMGFNVFLFCVDRVAPICISFIPVFIVLDKYQIKYDLESFLKKIYPVSFIYFIFIYFFILNDYPIYLYFLRQNPTNMY